MSDLAALAHAARTKLTTLSPESARLVSFSSQGNPTPQGSHRSVMTGQGIRIFDDNKNLSGWKNAVAWSAKAAMGSRIPSVLPIELIIDFVLPVPSKREGQLWPLEQRTGDLDKLVRAIMDAMTSIVYKDDTQVVRLLAMKRYSSPTRSIGATVSAYEIPSL